MYKNKNQNNMTYHRVYN